MLADGFDYYSSNSSIQMDILPPNAQQYIIKDLLPYGGYQIELKVILSSLNGSLPRLELDGNITGIVTTVAITDPEGKV